MIAIGHRTTFATKSQALSLTTVSSIEDCKTISWTPQHYILGAWSNTVFGTEVNRHIINVAILGREQTSTDPNTVTLIIGSGESWIDVVEWSVAQGRWWWENLIDIPGTVGWAVVQNIGAYGVEICQTVVSVLVYDFQTKQTFSLNNEQCQFGYRQSVFKTPIAQSRLIVEVTFTLTTTQHRLVTTYAWLDGTLDTPPNVCDRVRALRQAKLPDWTTIPTAGSFFANPVVDDDEKNRLVAQDSQLVYYPFGSQRKISAGYLIEKTIGKWRRLGKVGTYSKHALILVADESVEWSMVHEVATTIISLVHKKRWLTLVPEVLMVT